MNNLKKLLLFVSLLFGGLSFSQDQVGSAKISTSFCTILEGESEVLSTYVADATLLNWSSKKQAEKACGYYSSNLVTYQADFENNQLIIRIHVDRTSEKKDLNWWNMYLNDKCQ